MVEATLTYLRQGGWVMLPLVGVSLVMWALIVDRALRFRELGRGDLGVADAAEALARLNAACGTHHTLDSPAERAARLGSGSPPELRWDRSEARFWPPTRDDAWPTPGLSVCAAAGSSCCGRSSPILWQGPCCQSRPTTASFRS